MIWYADIERDIPLADTTFDIDISFSGDLAYYQYFSNAAALWELVITGDLADVTTGDVTIDDLHIDASVAAIDGEYNILAQASYSATRSTGG